MIDKRDNLNPEMILNEKSSEIRSFLHVLNFLFCAQDKTRTCTAERPLPPQSSVYTNFTTWAFSWCKYIVFSPYRKKIADIFNRLYLGCPITNSKTVCFIQAFISYSMIYFHTFALFHNIIFCTYDIIWKNFMFINNLQFGNFMTF